VSQFYRQVMMTRMSDECVVVTQITWKRLSKSRRLHKLDPGDVRLSREVCHCDSRLCVHMDRYAQKCVRL